MPRDLPDYLPQVRTGGVVVHVPPTQPTVIDYEQLGQAVAKHLTPALTPAFVEGARALPPQNLNITELRERIKKEEYWDTQTSIR